ncbi:MAG TPA: nicotinate-nucleotide adenylyltransferase [Cyanobacteria bacterium UBA8156]|jgi:nicotinate-nucleotide adenylyltransferase|nr:nicotinate-nucleotide adenylyltransferase [Cyanobacteria bacterium UBA8156]
MTAAIALFGTSADPPTVGHGSILRWLDARFGLVVVWVADNPFKQHRAALSHRAAMMALAIADLGESKVALHQEFSRPRTLETLTLVAARWPDRPLVLVVGTDVVAQIPTWYRGAEVLQRAELLVIARAGMTLVPATVAQIAALGGKLHYASAEVPPVSSTGYRDRGDRASVIPSVAAYIEREGLY